MPECLRENFFIRERINSSSVASFQRLNHTNFGVPNDVSTGGAFGAITTTYPLRQIQFGLKLMF